MDNTILSQDVYLKRQIVSIELLKIDTYVHTYPLSRRELTWKFCRDIGIGLAVELFVPVFVGSCHCHTDWSIHLCRFANRRIYNHLIKELWRLFKNFRPLNAF